MAYTALGRCASSGSTRPKKDAAIAASLRISDAVDQDVFDNSIVAELAACYNFQVDNVFAPK